MKKVTIGGKPTAKPAHSSPDDWVNAVQGIGQPTKRLTVDIPPSLHQRVKSQCALKGLGMADVVRTLLEQHFAQEHLQATPAYTDESVGTPQAPSFRSVASVAGKTLGSGTGASKKAAQQAAAEAALDMLLHDKE